MKGSFYRYCTNGLIATVLHFVLVYVIYDVFHLELYVATAIASFVAISFSYVGNALFVFRGRREGLSFFLFCRFLAAYFTIATGNATTVFVATTVMEFGSEVSLFLGLLVQVVAGYLIIGKLIFLGVEAVRE